VHKAAFGLHFQKHDRLDKGRKNKMGGKFKSLWLRMMLRLRYGDARLLGLLYWVRDPWEMESPREIFRFKSTNQKIHDQFGRIGTLLEIGCGEGHQSKHLVEICDKLLGADVSRVAVKRARARCGRGNFWVGDVFGADWTDLPSVDLVVACEVLYYLPDIGSALNRMSQLGSACFVTYYEGRSHLLDRYFAKLDPAQKATIQFGDTIWKTVWWRGQLPGSAK
jgi:SAM-dependent methyltransferase